MTPSPLATPHERARVLFAGTPAFALRSLEALIDAGMAPLAVLTRPDRPQGRGRKLVAGPVREYARARGIDVLQPATLRDSGIRETLAGYAPDILVVAAYGLLLPAAILALPRHGCLNVHASLLPRWRGAAPIQAAILAGDAESGISLMRMERGLDTGPVYATAAVAIRPDDTAGDLHDRLAALGGELLVSRLTDILAGRLAALPQDEALASYAPKIKSSDAVLDWRDGAEALGRRVRAFNPVPGARFRLAAEVVKCWGAVPGPAAAGRPGEILATGKDGVVVACGDGTLRLTELQRAGRGRITGAEFAAQYPLAGCVLPAAG